MNFAHAAYHIWDIKMSTRISAEKFRLRTVISLPALTKWMIHSVVGKVVIFKVEIVEIIAGRLYLLSLQNTDQLWLRPFEGNHNFSVFRILYGRFSLF